MAVDITGRHVNVTPAIRKFTLEKLEKLTKYLDDVIETHVILAVEKHRHVAEIIVHARTTRLSGSAETDDMYSAIGLVIDKLERQAKRHKEKIKRRGTKKGTASIRTALPAMEENGAARRGRNNTPASPDSPRIIRTNRYKVKPMTPEEAVLEVTGAQGEFVVFRNALSQRLSVVYKRPDGNFGLIEP